MRIKVNCERTSTVIDLTDLKSFPVWVNAYTVQAIHIDQEAYQFIQVYFQNLPKFNAFVHLEDITFFGDHAKFVVQVLIELYHNNKLEELIKKFGE